LEQARLRPTPLPLPPLLLGYDLPRETSRRRSRAPEHEGKGKKKVVQTQEKDLVEMESKAGYVINNELWLWEKTNK